MAELNSSPAKNDGKKPIRSRKSLRVDLTAMVDLAFLLVTFFMLTTTLSKPKAMDLAMPVDNTPPQDIPQSRSITLCLGSNNKVLMYNGLSQSPRVLNYGKHGLRKAIVDAKSHIRASTGKEAIVLVKPSNHSVYGNLVDALDELNITKTNIYAVVDITSADIDLLKSRAIY